MSLSHTPDKPLAPKRIAVMGAGISSLSTAYYLMKAGYEVDIYEAAPRAGGKIRTVAMNDGKGLSDHGGEFIDSDQKHILEMLRELKVPVIEANDTTASKYRMPNGKVISDDQFMKSYKPVANLVYKDKLAIAKDPTGERARYIDSLSVTEYLQELNGKVAAERPLWHRALFFLQRDSGVKQDVLTMAGQAYAAESMQPASRISALQFMHETGCESGDLIPSDCKYRIDGGTERMIDALKAKLTPENGVHIHLNSKVTGLQKDGNKFTMEINGKTTTQGYDQVVLGGQAHHVAGIKGMENFMSPEDLQAMRTLQGTAGSKLTIRTRNPVPLDGFFISSDGYEAWKRSSNEMVFMIGDDLSQKYPDPELIKKVLTDYAVAHNTTVDKMFDTSTMDFHGPDMNNFCYLSVGKNQYLALRGIARSADALAQQGIGLVGTYMPGEMQGLDGADSANVMGHGVESGYRATSILTKSRMAREQAMAMAQQQEYAPEGPQVNFPPATGRPKSGFTRV